MADTVMVQVRFRIQEGGLEYQDALYFTFDEYARTSQDEIDARKVARFQAWKQAREDASRIPNPTIPELETEVVGLEERLDEVNSKLTELRAK